MKQTYFPLCALVLLATSASYAADHAVCDDKTMAALHESERLVSSLRYDKLGQARVMASDGSMYTAGEVQWMRTQLHWISEQCTHSDPVTAAGRLLEVQHFIKEKHGSP